MIINPQNFRRFFIVVIACLSLTLPAAATAQEEPEPDPVNGATIYAARCANCHGIGFGGWRTSSQSAEPAHSHRRTEYLQGRDPFEIAQIIYNGRLQQGMPALALK